MAQRTVSTIPPNTQEQLTTLFALGREVASVLDLDELLHKIPQLIARLTKFQAFAVYLLDPKRNELSIAYSVGYPADVSSGLRLKVGHGLVGAAVADGQPILVNDVHTDSRYVEAVPGSQAELVVPLRRKGHIIGALNLLSDTAGQFTESDEAMLRQFGAHVAVAIENALLVEHEREYTSTLETLSEIAREFAAILNLDQLLTRIAHLTKRVIDYRTFGILLVNEETSELEMKVAVRYGDTVTVPRVKLGTGLVGYAALHTRDGARARRRRRPALHQGGRRCDVGAGDPAAAQGSLHRRVRPGKSRASTRSTRVTSTSCNCWPARPRWRSRTPVCTKPFSRTRIGWRKKSGSRNGCRRRCLPTELPKRIKGVDVAARFAPARELGGDLYDFLAPEPNSLVVAVGDVSGKGVPAALYSAFAGELIRSRTFRRRYAPERFSPAGVLASTNSILHERQLEEYYCTLCYAVFDFKRRTLLLANSGLPYPIRYRGSTRKVSQLVLPGVPLGSFAGSTYDELSLELSPGDVYVFCTDGVTEAVDGLGREFGNERLLAVIEQSHDKSARDIVDAIFSAAWSFRGDTPPNDDMTAVAIKITV